MHTGVHAYVFILHMYAHHVSSTPHTSLLTYDRSLLTYGRSLLTCGRHLNPNASTPHTSLDTYKCVLVHDALEKEEDTCLTSVDSFHSAQRAREGGRYMPDVC